MNHPGSAVEAPFPVEMRLPVVWGHMDAMGHVNNTEYFRFFESARVEYMIRMGLQARAGGSDAIVPILASTRCDFLRPLTHPDEVSVGARVVKVGRTSFTMEYRVWSIGQRCVSARGEGTVVTVSPASGRPVEIDAALRDAIDRIEARTRSRPGDVPAPPVPGRPAR
jgi:acyl-CoA thioester hydrolase